MPLRLLVGCRDRNLALQLCERIAQAVGSRINAEATGMDWLLSRAASIQPDVLLLEHEVAQEKDSWHVLGRMRQLSVATRFLLLCNTYTHLMVVDFVRRGVNGCVLNATEPSLLAKAVLQVHSGDTWFGRTALLQALRSQVATEPVFDSPSPEDQELLTQREREILGLIGSAMSNKEIARRLQISDKTVKTHLHHIYVKLNQSGRYKAFLSNVSVVSSPYPEGLGGPPQ